MERSKIKLIFVFILLVFAKIYSQGLFVHYEHPVYSFLERMEANGLIENYNNEIKPLMRSKIVDYLTEIFDKRFNLNEIDKEFLNYFIDEFYFDLTGRLDRYEILFGLEKFSPLNNKEKFIGEDTLWQQSEAQLAKVLD
ncbi:MAG: hypothetical protein ACK4G1_02880, partial [Ignavibacteria bacterium]